MQFLFIIDVPSSYNVILGRPSLNVFQAVVSTFHMKMKFPIGDEVGEVMEDQFSSRRCYVDTIKADRLMQKDHSEKKFL
ncbi:hypothetical protein ACS0TY_003819 [Phlomoides rotata]